MGQDAVTEHKILCAYSQKRSQKISRNVTIKDDYLPLAYKKSG